MRIVIGAYLLSGTPGYRQAGVHQYALQLLSAFSRDAKLRVSTPITTLISPTAREQAASLHGASLNIHEVSRTTEEPLSRIYIEQIETPRL